LNIFACLYRYPEGGTSRCPIKGNVQEIRQCKLFQNSVVKIKDAQITENVVQIICQCVADLAKITISGCYIAERARSDFLNEKARRCSGLNNFIYTKLATFPSRKISGACMGMTF